MNLGWSAWRYRIRGRNPRPYAIMARGYPWVTPLLAVKEVNCPTALHDHQGGPVVVAIKCKPRSTGPLMSHHLQHGGAVILIERIVCINEEKPPVILLGVLLPQELQYVDFPPISRIPFPYIVALSHRPLWFPPPSPPARTLPASAARSLPLQLAIHQGIC